RRARAAAWFRHHPVAADMTLLDEKFYKTDFYNLLWRPLDQHYGIVAPVIENGKLVGLLGLFRPRTQQPFNSKEQTLCTRLTPYVAHALRTQSDGDIPYSENSPSGMMIMSAEGAIIYLCNRAKTLLTLASHPVLIMDRSFKETGLLPKLTQLCRNLNAIFRGKDAAPPSLCYTNPRGRFICYAYWLNRQNKEAGALIGITIEYQEPKVLNILRSMQSLPLSPTQKEVALLLAQGYSADKIGQRLPIKLTTVKDHIRKIYVKLDIHQRDELMPKLLALDTSLRNQVSKASLDLC
ncbi:MAG: LuxR C-terminal-related transcriptional regulator, partial [Methylobacter sp.]